MRVVVIGGGVVGLCSAYSLAKRGYEVVVLELDKNPGTGCSTGNGGIVTPSHFVPLAAPGMMMTGLKMLMNPKSPFGFTSMFSLETLGWIAKFTKASTKNHVERSAPVLRDLNLASRSLYADLAKVLDIGYEQNGLLMLCQTQAALDEEAHLAEKAKQLGLLTKVLDAQGLEQKEPGVRSAAIGGVWFRDDAHLTPLAVIHSLRERLAKMHVEVRDGVEVQSFNTKSGVIHSVATTAGNVGGDEFVLAAGAWTGMLARKLKLKLPMLSGKGYGFTVPNAPIKPTMPAILVEARVAVTPMLDGVRFVGTMELGSPDQKINEARVSGIKESVASFYPSVSSDLLAQPIWKGMRPCSPDGLPYLGKTRAAANLTIAAGHAMMGMSLGPISGEIVTQLIAGESPAIDLKLLNPDRYA